GATDDAYTARSGVRMARASSRPPSRGLRRRLRWRRDRFQPGATQTERPQVQLEPVPQAHRGRHRVGQGPQADDVLAWLSWLHAQLSASTALARALAPLAASSSTN